MMARVDLDGKVMTAELAALLRAPFKPEEIGKLPRVSCQDCRDRKCNKHMRERCEACRNYITTAHTHLDYVGHAEVTDRFLQVDREWSWEPLACDADGLPKFDQIGGLWIKLTIAGVTRLGYGNAAPKKGPDALKEAIGDALRNAGMRFGVAIDLWGAKFDDGAEEPTTPQPPVATLMIQDLQRNTIFALWKELGFEGEEKREQRLDITSKLLGGIPLESTSDLTAAEADALIRHLRERLQKVKREAEKEAQA